MGNSTYEGKNTLNYVDNVDHRQWSVTLGADTQVNKKHLLSYGIGLYGRQAKVADLKMRLIPINGISIPGITIKSSGKNGVPSSTIYDHSFRKTTLV